MCRLMAYVGQPQLLADIVLWPDRSIIKQSYDARERKIDPTLPFHLGHGNLNGDGFGIGWFSTEERRESDPTPCVFTSITPAWNNENLSRLACKIVSPLVFAHVRAAYPGMPVSEQNCHPFQFSRYMWMHNGVVAGFGKIRRALLETLSDCAYNAVASFHSDSAVSFGLFLHHLPDIRAQLPPDVLIKAMQEAIATICTVQRRYGITATSLLNYVVSDGSTLIATRFVSPESEGPASLYYAEGASFARTQAPVPKAAAAAVPPAVVVGCGGALGGAAGPGFAPCSASANSGSSITQESSYELGLSAQGPEVVFVASEPITASASDWVAVPKNTSLIVTREKRGFLNILRCPLRNQTPLQRLILNLPPSPGASPTHTSPIRGSQPWVANSGASGPMPWTGPAPPFVDPQRDVCLCLEALSRGIMAKSRAFLARRPTGLNPGSAVLPAAAETLQDLPSMTSIAGGSAASLGRNNLAGQQLPLEVHTGQSGTTDLTSRAPSQALADVAPPEDGDAHEFMRLVGHSGPIMAMTVCSHTHRLYTSSVDSSMRVWNMHDNSCLHTMIGQRKPVTAMRLRAKGRLLLAASGRNIRVWDTVGFRCLQLIKISDSCGTIRCLEVCPMMFLPQPPQFSGNPGAAKSQEADLATLSSGMALEPNTDERAQSSLVGDEVVSGVSLPPCARYSSMDSNNFWGWHDGMAPSAASTERGEGATSVDGRVSGAPSGLSMLYVGCQDTTVKVFTLYEQEMLQVAAAAQVSSVPPREERVQQQQPATTRAVGVTTPPPSPFVLRAAGTNSQGSRMSVTGNLGPPALLPPRIIAATEDQEQGISDLAPLFTTTAEGGAHVGPVNCLALCGRYLCSGGGDATVRVWDASTLKLVGVLRGHRGCVLCLLCLGASTLLSGARDNTIRVWDLEMDMMCRRTLTGHKDDVTGLSAQTLQPRGAAAATSGMAVGTPQSPSQYSGVIRSGIAWASTLVASSSADGTVRLWSTSWTCLCILSLPASTSVPSALCGCLSASVAMAGYSDGEVRLWHVGEVHRALLRTCYEELAAAADTDGTPRTACGCMGHGGGQGTESMPGFVGGSDISRATSLQALAHVQQHGTSGATAMGASLPGGRCVGKGGMEEALSLLSRVAGDVADRDDNSEEVTLSLPRKVAVVGVQPTQPAISPPPPPLPPLPQQQQASDGRICAEASPATQPSGMAAEAVDSACSPSLLPQAPSSTSSSSAPVVPIHIHGRQSPLSGSSMVNIAALVGACTNEATSAACSAAAGDMVPGVTTAAAGLARKKQLPLGVVTGSQSCSKSDQELEAALRDFVRIKTVSNSPKLRDDCHKGAKFLAKMLERLGADVKVVQVYEDKNPVVIGRLGHNPELPTVTFYGHYDMQPAAEPDWATNPFELNSVNEYLYGRGVSDNKGPILAFIFAVRELMNSCGDTGSGAKAGGGRQGRLPVNIAFIFEGEEENGSRGFSQAITQNLRWFEGTQLIIISNTLWVGENVPCLTYGMRGMLSLTVQITGPERDLHSGNDGGVFAEPMVDLLRVMATLIGPDGRVQVPGFYDNVEPDLIHLAWASLEESEEFSLEGYKAALGVPALTAPPHKLDLLVTRWCRPSLSVVDMRPGAGGPGAGQQSEPTSTCSRFGPTRFSVIPKAAQGKVSVRFVPNQDADHLVACFRSHLERSFADLGSNNRIDLQVEARGNWWEVRQGSPWLAKAETAIYKEWGVQPLYVREGGTMPVASYLERMLSAPAIMIPMGQSSDNCHLANERIRRTNLFKGKNVIRRLLEEIANMPGTTADPAAPTSTHHVGNRSPHVAVRPAASVTGVGGGGGGGELPEGLGAATACAGLME